MTIILVTMFTADQAWLGMTLLCKGQNATFDGETGHMEKA